MSSKRPFIKSSNYKVKRVKVVQDTLGYSRETTQEAELVNLLRHTYIDDFLLIDSDINRSIEIDKIDIVIQIRNHNVSFTLDTGASANITLQLLQTMHYERFMVPVCRNIVFGSALCVVREIFSLNYTSYIS